MKAILSADLNWGIGCGGKLLQHVPEDMRFFMNMTMGKVVVMGRETFESLPGMQPLKERVNIILSKNADYWGERLMVCRSLEELSQELRKYNTDDVFVIGGESVYVQLLPYCSEAYITRFEKQFEADRHFPNLDSMEGWKLDSESEPSCYKDMNFRFLKYVNTAVTGTFST